MAMWVEMVIYLHIIYICFVGGAHHEMNYFNYLPSVRAPPPRRVVVDG